MGTIANGENQNEMQHYAAFHQSLHILLRLKQPSGTELRQSWENLTMTP